MDSSCAGPHFNEGNVLMRLSACAIAFCAGLLVSQWATADELPQRWVSAGGALSEWITALGAVSYTHLTLPTKA